MSVMLFLNEMAVNTDATRINSDERHLGATLDDKMTVLRRCPAIYRFHARDGIVFDEYSLN